MYAPANEAAIPLTIDDLMRVRALLDGGAVE
jgi:hypothetical protein